MKGKFRKKKIVKTQSKISKEKIALKKCWICLIEKGKPKIDWIAKK